MAKEPPSDEQWEMIVGSVPGIYRTAAKVCEIFPFMNAHYDELFDAGLDSLVSASGRFDPHKSSASFYTFSRKAVWWCMNNVVCKYVRRRGVSFDKSECKNWYHDRQAQDPADCLMENELADRADRAISMLSPKRQKVVRKYFYEDMTMKEVGKSIDPPVSPQRVHQLLAKSYSELREKLRADWSAFF